MTTKTTKTKTPKASKNLNPAQKAWITRRKLAKSAAPKAKAKAKA